MIAIEGYVFVEVKRGWRGVRRLTRDRSKGREVSD